MRYMWGVGEVEVGNRVHVGVGEGGDKSTCGMGVGEVGNRVHVCVLGVHVGVGGGR